MNTKELYDLFKITYQKTVKDNEEDFLKMYELLLRLCTYLITKNILTESDVKDILVLKK